MTPYQPFLCSLSTRKNLNTRKKAENWNSKQMPQPTWPGKLRVENKFGIDHMLIPQYMIRFFFNVIMLLFFLFHSSGITLSKIGNSALNMVHAASRISSLLPGSCPRNWLQGNAKISNPARKHQWWSYGFKTFENQMKSMDQGKCDNA